MSDVALRHKAGVEHETHDPREAYAGYADEHPGRLEDKDALDVFRLMRGTPTEEMARRVSLVLSDSRSADSARVAIAAFPALFAQASGSGVQMALRATAGLMADAEVSASLVTLAKDLSAKLSRAAR